MTFSDGYESGSTDWNYKLELIDFIRMNGTCLSLIDNIDSDVAVGINSTELSKVDLEKYWPLSRDNFVEFFHEH